MRLIGRYTKKTPTGSKSPKIPPIGLPEAGVDADMPKKAAEEDIGLCSNACCLGAGINPWARVSTIQELIFKLEPLLVSYPLAEDDYYDEDEVEEEPESYSLAKMLNNRNDDDYYGFDDPYD